MGYKGQVELKSSDIKRQTITGSTSATHTLNWTPPNEQSLIVTINGVKQHDASYSITAPNSLVLSAALLSTDEMEVIGINDAGQTITPAQGSVTNDMISGSAAIALSKLATDPSNASNLASGTVPTARLGSGSASSSTVLHGDNTWAEISGGTAWQSVQTTAFTAVAGNGYPINTTASAITVTLPASASVGDTIEFVDYAGTCDTNAITLDRNGLNIRGETRDRVIRAHRAGIKLVYVDATQGWETVTSRTANALTGTLAATGGVVTYVGDSTIHTFTTSGNFVAVGSADVEVLIVAGGGGGASQHSGGGGAGGYRSISSIPVTSNTYSIVVGAGGAGGQYSGGYGGDGSVSSGLGYSSAGGGGAGSYSAQTGRTGGSGGGGGTDYGTGGTGNTPSTSPAQGNNGGAASQHHPSPGGGGGGGGSGAVGTDGGSGATGGGDGGVGTQNNIDGNNYFWAGGGGGASHMVSATSGDGGQGGGGGGGNAYGPAGSGGTGGINNGGDGITGTSGTTGGAGGQHSGGGGGGSGSNADIAGAGGSGIVIIKYAT
ncbi:MAG: hypothetical protein GY905_08715 [Gammaproteobacteria bacterium]|nr:hypothetical protein [Gammaproteobacteria bacterium]